MRALLLTILVVLAGPSLAAIDAYEFKDEQTESRFQELTAELRCPKCQNNNIADSNSPIASDLRREVYRMVQSGASDEEVIDFMVTRYGEFVLYRPRVNEMTWLLWYGPFVLLAIGLIVVVVIAKRRKRSAEPGADSSGLSQSERERLNKLLEQDKK
ncbi:MAG: cytochrome c-type biogenesis protein CcmH [Oceanospirillaceae bacterium]|jgi:cytochrome c-type biogenesis protein CcmH|uniref:cytochrome c-type biogenesis protein n=1 Tax=Marinobacterium litorale TaxID=404770 RepID=UPI00042A048F|nr:cytochrome c-type biogenesis protein [Marinobacterium litorale]MBT00246.1 cytochrome c-type biogenesis protein CcmH [Oceanospirillaceae bacterium]